MQRRNFLLYYCNSKKSIQSPRISLLALDYSLTMPEMRLGADCGSWTDVIQASVERFVTLALDSRTEDFCLPAFVLERELSITRQLFASLVWHMNEKLLCSIIHFAFVCPRWSRQSRNSFGWDQSFSISFANSSDLVYFILNSLV